WLAEDEREQVLTAWNRTALPPPRAATLPELVSRQVALTPHATAVRDEAGNAFTYAELEARSNQVARWLRRQGVGPEVRVGILLERGAEVLAVLLGILKAGGVYIPLDAAYPADRLDYMLHDSGATLLLAHSSLAYALPEGSSPIFLDHELEAVERESADPIPDLPEGENAAYIIYTSGSTGRPKGVVVQHRGLVHFLTAMADRLGVEPDDVFAAVSTVAFDIAALDLYLPLLAGASSAVSHRETARDPARLAAFLDRVGATVMQATPPTWLMLVHNGWEGRAGMRALTGAEALTRTLAEALAARCASVVNLYGPTEATVWTTTYLFAPGETADPVPLGRPLAHTAVYVLDAAGRPVPAEVWGELCLGGAQVSRGYQNRTGLTADRFVPDPYSGHAGARTYRTGDRARWRADGVLEFGGRLDSQIKLRGYRIEPGEVETVLRGHPEVREAAVVAREDGGERRLVAYIVAEGEAPSPAALRTHAGKGLPAYMVPGAFVVLDRLPLTPSGKVDRRALPAPELGAERTAYTAPRTPTEEVLAGIWSEVLGVERVGAHDHFFTLGGHSLLLARVAARAGEAFGHEVPLRLVFEHPTISELAEHVDALRRDGQQLRLDSVTPVPRDGALPLSFGQERLWFLDRLVPGSAAYNLPLVLRLSGPLDADALARALSALARRHEVLRTVFGEADGAAVQVILPDATPLESLVDLSKLPEAEQEREVRRHTEQVALGSFDLAAEPPLRARLLRIAADQHVLALCVHHAASDGWSQALMLREIAALYDAFAGDLPSPLPDLPVQYADFAAWQRRHLAGERLEAQLGYWRERLAGVAPLDLPTDRPRPAVQTLRGKAVAAELAPRTDALRGLAHAEGCTLFMILLAGWQALLARVSGQDDVVVGSPIAGRTRPELEGLIGFFVNTLALRTDLSGDPTFRELLGRVRETTLGAYQHQELPFERLVEELAPERTLGRNPLVQTIFTLQTDVPPEEIAAGAVRIAVQGAATGATR
ncbi:MAG TPA: amino acid adenylation domain-containing protein, partial [Longimicrobium sp.]|nr:amino acid adenylation domain-containing protein [Longimicrobium sp.]